MSNWPAISPCWAFSGSSSALLDKIQQLNAVVDLLNRKIPQSLSRQEYNSPRLSLYPICEIVTGLQRKIRVVQFSQQLSMLAGQPLGFLPLSHRILSFRRLWTFTFWSPFLSGKLHWEQSTRHNPYKVMKSIMTVKHVVDLRSQHFANNFCPECISY